MADRVVYIIPGKDPGDLPDDFFSYDGSTFLRWDAAARAWVKVNKTIRNFYLDRLEAGDGTVPASLAEQARLH